MSLSKALIAAASALLVASPAHASVAAACFDAAGREFGVNPLLLEAIARHESGMRVGAVGRNRDGTRDLGLMQINSRHLSELARYGIDEARLLTDACTNVRVGARVLARAVAAQGPTWRAVGSYNTGAGGRDSVRAGYVSRVAREYRRLQTQRGGALPLSTAVAAADPDRANGDGQAIDPGAPRAVGRMRVYERE